MLLQKSNDRSNGQLRLTEVSCYKLGNVLLKPMNYAAFVHYMQWNGFAEDQACCINRYKDTLYCAASVDMLKMAQLMWMHFTKLCDRRTWRLSYRSVSRNRSSPRRACVLLSSSRSTLVKLSSRKLYGADRTPKVAIYNFRNASEASLFSKIEALRRLRKLRSPRGFYAISGTDQRLFTRTKRYCLGRVYTVIFNFNSLYFTEYWGCPWHRFFLSPACIEIFAYVVKIDFNSKM